MTLFARRATGIAFATALSAAALSVAPLSALAVTSATTSNGYHEYRIEFLDDRAHGSRAGVEYGRLQLRYERDGIINGFYRRFDGGPLVTIDGSLEGRDVNLRFANVTINGKLDQGNIVGGGFVGGSEVIFQAIAKTDAPLPAPGKIQ